MLTGVSRNSIESDEYLRDARLARGLRAVASTVIIGGIVIAAFDNAPPASRATPRDATAGQVDSHATDIPLVNPSVTPRPEASGRDDPRRAS